MVSPRMRPRFELRSELAPDEVLERLQRALDTRDEVDGIVLPETAELTIPDESRHFWSPQLMLSVREPDAEDEDGSLVLGRYGPHHHVWAMFVAIYSVLAFIGGCGLILGFSQWTLGASAWALWGVPVAGALIALTYVAALSGQALGADQMHVLRDVVDDCLAGSVPDSASDPLDLVTSPSLDLAS